MEKEKMNLFIPQGLKPEREYFQGFAKKELQQAVIGSVFVLAVLLLGYILTKSVLVVIMILILGEMTVISLVTRSPVTNMSVYTQIKKAVVYHKQQQEFRYRQIWEEEEYDTLYHR